MTAEIDARLAELLAAPERGPDDRFVHLVELEVEALHRVRLARRKLWRRFASEAAAGAVIVFAFLVLARSQPPGPDGSELVLFSPAMLGVLLLGLWAAATLPVRTADPA